VGFKTGFAGFGSTSPAMRSVSPGRDAVLLVALSALPVQAPASVLSASSPSWVRGGRGGLPQCETLVPLQL